MQKQALLIVNPFSGKKSGEKTAAYISAKLQNIGFETLIAISHSLSELKTCISQRDLNSFSFIGIIGGDGSMHEFINAALALYDSLPPIALFPCGTGNAFNFDIGCATVDETLDCISNNSVSFIDVAQVNFPGQTLWSFNILGCGLVAEINRLAENLRWLGGARYNVASLIKLLANPSNELVIETDEGKITGKFSFVLACNTRYTGKGMMMAPMAKLSDGKFDVLLVKKCTVLKLLQLFPKIFKGNHIGADVLTYIQTSTLRVTSLERELITNIDGELKGKTPLNFKVHNNKIKVFVKS